MCPGDDQPPTSDLLDTRQYWEERLGRRYGLDGVGYDGLSNAYNQWMYRIRREVFLRVVREHVETRGRVLDVGSGTGFYIDRWQELAAEEIFGSDITELAVGKLRERFPEQAFSRWEIGDTRRPFPDQSFDVVSAMDVLFHIVDDAKFRQAFHDFGALIRPEGVLIFSDNFRHGPVKRIKHIVVRPAEQIEAYVEEAGFRLVTRLPMFVLMNAPASVDSRLLWLIWSGFSRMISTREAAGDLAGRLLFPLERRLIRRLKSSPSTEIAVYRKSG